MGNHQEDGTMFASFLLLLEHEMYTHYTRSAGRVEQCMQSLVQYEASRQDWSVIVVERKSRLKVVEIFGIMEHWKGEKR